MGKFLQNGLKTSKSESLLKTTSRSYGNSKTVYAVVNTTVEVGDIYMMDIILENWSSISKETRHEFARRIAVLDFQDSIDLSGLEDESEDEFHWR